MGPAIVASPMRSAPSRMACEHWEDVEVRPRKTMSASARASVTVTWPCGPESRFPRFGKTRRRSLRVPDCGLWLWVSGRRVRVVT